MLCGNFIGIDKLERLKLLQSDLLINEFAISIKEPETVSRILGNFSYKTTHMLRGINFKVFKKLLQKSKIKVITIDTYTANGAAEIIKEIVTHIKTDDLEILFRMDSGYFDDDIITTIESAGCKYLIMRSTTLAREKSIQHSPLKLQHQPFHLRKVIKAEIRLSLLPNWTAGTKTEGLSSLTY